MARHQFLRNIQPNPHAGEGVGGSVAGAIKARENVRQFGGGNADAIVADPQHHFGFIAYDLDAHSTTHWTIFDRVVQQILDHLLQSQPITQHPTRFGRQIKLAGVAFQRRSDFPRHLPSQSDEIHWFHGHTEAAFMNARDVEKRFDQIIQALGLVEQRLHGLTITLAGLFAALETALQHLGAAHNRGHRRVQFVGRHCHKLVAQLERIFGSPIQPRTLNRLGAVFGNRQRKRSFIGRESPWLAEAQN